MTDKVQKIREEVERLMTELIQEKEKGFGSDIDDACILELQNVLTFIDTLQEEPVSEDLEEAADIYSKSVKIWNTQKKDIRDGYIPDSFKAGARWQKEKIINKACDWLWEYTFDDNLIKNFRKSMED